MQASKNCFIFVKLLSCSLFLKKLYLFYVFPSDAQCEKKKTNVYTNFPENNMLPKILDSMAPWGLRECWTIGSIFKVSNFVVIVIVECIVV
jgi:hypothetical protein